MIVSIKTKRLQSGFSLIELMIAVGVIGVLAAIAIPSYTQYAIRSSRQAAQSELVILASIQEKIYLNSNAYASNVIAPYSGSFSGGLGVTSGKSRDGKYMFSVTVSSATYTLIATPTIGSSQSEDGTISIDAAENKIWGNKTW